MAALPAVATAAALDHVLDVAHPRRITREQAPGQAAVLAPLILGLEPLLVTLFPARVDQLQREGVRGRIQVRARIQ